MMEDQRNPKYGGIKGSKLKTKIKGGKRRKTKMENTLKKRNESTRKGKKCLL